MAAFPFLSVSLHTNSDKTSGSFRMDMNARTLIERFFVEKPRNHPEKENRIL